MNSNEPRVTVLNLAGLVLTAMLAVAAAIAGGIGEAVGDWRWRS